MFTFSTLSLLLPIVIFLHVTEEFLFPGGFIEWYRKLVPSKTTGIKPSYLVWINTVMIGVCIFPLYFGETVTGLSFWYCISLSTAINGGFHIWGVIKLKQYSPGFITAVLLYIPLFITGGTQLITSGLIPASTIIVCTAAAIGYHLLSVKRQGS